MKTKISQSSLPFKLEARAELYREKHELFATWAAGTEVIKHSDEIQCQVYELVEHLVLQGAVKDYQTAYQMLIAADTLCSAAMWLVVHMTYAQNVYLDGRELSEADFKPTPEGHTGGALNMVPAYVGYLVANALSGKTRGWVMGQGHCVAAIDALNVLVGNLNHAHAERYGVSDDKLTRMVRDFYAYTIAADGKAASPLGSHVNPHTAGGIIEGGYLGFAELYYVHMPLPGEELVAFLSDGSFEEQRGADWTPRWWRPQDSGAVCPIMIANGRRIDQRTTMSQEGGVDWFKHHLLLHNFEPIMIDGRDPAAFVWAILQTSELSAAMRTAAERGEVDLPCRLPYVIAETVKGFGFPGAGTNRAHNLPLEGNPAKDSTARKEFNDGVKKLWRSPAQLTSAVTALNNHGKIRLREKDNVIANRDVSLGAIPSIGWQKVGDTAMPPMDAVDRYFCDVVAANPQLRPRVGNPDELSSNRMIQTLAMLKHRVTAPEAGLAEAIDGAVITALNEEAVVSAALANKGGINIAVSYEAFAVKMLGAIRQELIFARHQKEIGQTARWLSVPIIVTSHTWENGKNEQSHQDPTLAETMLGEMSDVSRVVFPVDANSAAACLAQTYQTQGQIWCHVVAKRPVACLLSQQQAEEAINNGGVVVENCDKPELVIAAIGSYQLLEAKRAAERLEQRGVKTRVVAIIEPGRFRIGRDYLEQQACVDDKRLLELFPHGVATVLLAHCRVEPLYGVLRRIDKSRANFEILGYCNRGGTLDSFGMLYANATTWGHAIAKACQLLGGNLSELLSNEEISAVRGEGDPYCLA